MLGQRLKFIREQRGLSSTELAEALGVTKPTYSNYESEKIKPSIPVLEKISRTLNVSADYLLGLSNDDKLSWAEYQFSNNAPEGFQLAKVPILKYACADSPHCDDEDIEGWDVVLAEMIDGHECYFLRVRGDSMSEARICDGDLVFVRKQSDVDDGDIAVVLTDFNEATIKRVFKKNKKIVLVPENKKYTPKEYDEVTIIGKILWTKVVSL
jgi:repressor LexA